MSKETKKGNTMNGGLYIALAICILSVICIGVYSAIINIFDGDLLGSETVPKVSSTKGSPVVVVEKPEDTDSLPPASKPQDATPPAAVEDSGSEVVVLPEVSSFTRPVGGSVLKAFSDDVLVYSATMNDYHTHMGVDLLATLGEPVKAFADGVISEIYEDPLMGQTVVIDHGNGLKSVYQNLSSELPDGIEAGKQILEGEVIGGVGETVLIECAEEPHLHFEVIKNDTNVNPMGYFE